MLARLGLDGVLRVSDRNGSGGCVVLGSTAGPEQEASRPACHKARQGMPRRSRYIAADPGQTIRSGNQVEQARCSPWRPGRTGGPGMGRAAASCRVAMRRHAGECRFVAEVGRA